MKKGETMFNWRSMVVVGLLLAINSTVQAAGVDTSINNDNVRMSLNWDNPKAGPRNLEREIAVYYNTNSTIAGTIGLMVIGETGNRSNPLEFAMGAKAIVINAPGGSVTGLALGFDTRYYPANINRLAFVGNIYFSPDVIAFGPTTSIVDSHFRIEYQVMAYAFAHVGIRNFYAKHPSGDITVADNQIMIGFRLLFD